MSVNLSAENNINFIIFHSTGGASTLSINYNKKSLLDTIFNNDNFIFNTNIVQEDFQKREMTFLFIRINVDYYLLKIIYKSNIEEIIYYSLYSIDNLLPLIT